MSSTCYIIILLLTIIAVSCKETPKNNSDVVDNVILTAPVLAPPNNSRALVTETAKDFPSLLVIGTKGSSENRAVENPEVIVETSDGIQPIYVKKLKSILFTGRKLRKTPKL